jgi:diadenylate cyclase
MPLLQSALDQISPNMVADVAITAVLIYWLFSLIRGTRAVRLLIGVCLLLVVYAAAIAFDLRLLTLILQTGAYVGVIALVVVFQPELRRALDRIGRLGSLGWLLPPAEQSQASHIAMDVASAAARLSSEGVGALIVIERESGLQEIAESGVMLHADLTVDLLVTIFSPKTPLHDGAVIIRGEGILAAGAILPSSETTIPLERFGTRHKAALGMTEQTDALVVVVSEETGQISLVERARIVRNLDEPKLARALLALLHPKDAGTRLRETVPPGRVRAPLGRFTGRVRTNGRRVESSARHHLLGRGQPIESAPSGKSEDESNQRAAS